ncbi:EAL domain-containing protein [Colwellia psychrerythraea]|uniref:cyclic-guanylate-specific phosphodiesterase n=1 Tax=Colwellia psychrerythraea (strain 34H / ATCC BAA-681) TaxID=167879 RepID=Q47UD6_COLP3|nr:EAL domain-containing protein [Colwellia psychrerythraea]AAZ28167.1 sensory box sensor/GGDEF/EAL domain protein [Colwellia psychrerythraea 34H]
MSSIRAIVKAKNTILFKFSFGMSLLFLVMTAATYMVVDLVVKNYLVNKNKESIDEIGSHIVSEISQRISIAETLTRHLAAAGETWPQDPQLFYKVIPQMLNMKEYQDIIAGGGVWPEPQQFTLGVVRRSFFWGRDNFGELQYFDQYNDVEGTGYHDEEWYVPGRYSKQGECLWSKSYMDPYTLAPMVTCTVAMFKQEVFSGNATVDVSLQQLKSILHQGSAKLRGYAYAVDRNNKFLSFPDDELTKVANRDSNHLTQEYITVNQLAEKLESFQPIAEILTEINQSLIQSIADKTRVPAANITEQSKQISPLDAQLIVANMSTMPDQSSHRNTKTISVISKQDFLLGEAVNVSVFIIPKTLWKVVVVTPQMVAINSASKVSNLILMLLIAIMIIAAFLGFIYCRRSLIMPIYQMVNQLQRPVTEGGQVYPELLDDRRQDEFGLLAYHFNQSKMALDSNNRDLKLQINERKQAEYQLKHLALHDPLTGLPNRLLFQDRLEQAIALSDRHQHKFAVFFMDLDNFKIINDTMGHDAGDELLKQVSLRLSCTGRKTDTVARLGGDEFAFIITKVNTIEDAVTFAQRLNSLLKTPIEINGNNINMGSSIGITIYPDDAANSEELLRNADIAMYQAKDDGRNTVRFFTSEMNARLQRNKEVLTDLAESLTKEHFELYYQPLFTIDQNILVGAEALIRWHHPEKGMIPPDQFIAVAEKSGLINELGDWVLAQACREIKNFLNAGITVFKVAINISPVQFRRKDLLQHMLMILAQHDVSAELIELEITEGAVMDNVDQAIETMQALHDAGFQLAMDDFGTGYSSLSYLKRFPIQKVKIDRSFISDLENDDDSKSITTAIIQMSHSLGLHVLAEGVETEEQLHYLQAEKCDYVQGYYTGRPIPASEFIKNFSESKKGKYANGVWTESTTMT